MLGSKQQRTEGIRRQAQELIDQAYERGFKAGKEEFVTTGNKVADKAYQNGVDDAWECARKIMRMGSTKQEDIFCCHGDLEILEKLLPSEAIAKIKAYEEQKKAEEEEIKVWDEVCLRVSDCIRGIVTKITGSNELYIVYPDGSASQRPKDQYEKTGRSFPQIAEVLKQLQEGE